MVKTRRSGGNSDEVIEEDILTLIPQNRHRIRPKAPAPQPPESDESGQVVEEYRPARKKYNMRSKTTFRRYAEDSESNHDEEVVLSKPPRRERLNDSPIVVNGDIGEGTRRSTRRRRMVYDTFNLASIDKYPVAGSQFDEGLARHSRRKTPSPNGKYAREMGALQEDGPEEEGMDMYSRVKRPRRQVKKDMYGVPLNDENENGPESENGSTTEIEGSGEEKNEEEESESEEEGPRQYYLREHRPRTQIFDAAPAPSHIRRQPKLMNIIPHSPARRRTQFSSHEHKSPAHRSRSFRNRRRPAFHGSSSTSSSSSSSSDEERFERRKSKSMQRSRNRCLPMNLQSDDITGVLKDRQKIGSSLADVDPMNIDRSVTFESVGGLCNNIRALKEMIIFPLMYPEVFDKFHIQPPRGVLFYGPPGTGKTLVARALANECSKGEKRVSFFMRKGADCLSKWVGESERQLRLLFDQAYQMRPSILFFDEIDGLAPVRSSRQDQIHSSIVSTLLALMDGLDSRGEVVIIGATNRIDSIDPALRRPGRFDREFLFPLPSLPARKQILQIHTSKWNPPLEEKFVDGLAERSVGYCGADLRSLCTEAALFALRRRYPQIYTTSDKLQLDINSIRIGVQDFSRAIERIVPASQRSVASPGRTMSPFILPLLKRQFQTALQQLRKIFPVASKSTAQDDLILSDQEDDAFTQSSTYRPRLVIAGHEGQGQSSHLAPALIHHMEQYPVHVLDLPALYAVSAKTPEESCAQVFREAKRTSPSIIYMPHIDQWWEAVTDTLTATFTTLLQDVAPTAPVLLLATCDRAVGDLAPTVQAVFWHGSRLVMQNPNAEERRLFFEELFVNMVCKVPSRRPESDELEVLSIAPAPEPRKLTDKEQKILFEHEDATLRELRLFLRDVINKLGQDRKFGLFTKPVDISEVEDYYDVIKSPMDLSTMMSKIDLHQYQTANGFLKDIDLICTNALEYNPDKNPADKSIRHRACALRDLAQSIMENELDPDFEKRCEEIDEARNKRGASPSNSAPEFYKVPPKARATRSSAPILVPSPRIQSDPETSLQSTPMMKPKAGRKVTPRSADKVRVMSSSAFKALQAKKLRLSPWCRPSRRRRAHMKRIVVIDDDEEEDVNEEAQPETDDKSNLTPIEEKTEEDSGEATPKKKRQVKSRDTSPEKNHKVTESPEKIKISDSPAKAQSAKSSPDKASEMETSPVKLLEVQQSMETAETDVSPSKPRTPVRSPRSGSPRIISNIIVEPVEVNGASESSESTSSMPKLSAPSVIHVSNEDSNKENDLPQSGPQLLPENSTDNDRKRKRSESEIETENESENATPKLSPRVTRYRSCHPAPPPLVIDKQAMAQLWTKTVEKTHNFDVETLENLHCQLRECVHMHKDDYNKGQLLQDLRSVLDDFFSRQPCSNTS